MIKKSLVSLVTISLFTIGGTSVFASSDVTQAQTNDASVSYTQGSETSSPIDRVQLQKGNSNLSSVQLGKFGIAGQGQAGSVSGVQLQSAKTSSPTLLIQTLSTKLKLTDQQNMGTTVNNTLTQSTATVEPSQVVQAQVDHTAAVQVEASVAGGPTVQYQQVHRTSIQHQNAVKSVSPINTLR